MERDRKREGERKLRGRASAVVAVGKTTLFASNTHPPSTPAPPLLLQTAPFPTKKRKKDISIGNLPAGRITMELFADVAPRTAENFRQLCTGEFRPRDGLPQGSKGSQFHRVIRGFMAQGGDFVKGDGTGSASIYGSKFADEPFVAKHTGPGLLSSANSGPDSNGCQFFLTCAKSDWLDNKHVVFGRVLGDSLLVVRKVEAVPTSGAGNRPSLPVVITECGEM